MSLFADKWPSAFDSNPFGFDGFRSSSVGGFRWGSNRFGDRPDDDDDFPPRMRIRNAPSLTERGFYDDFDSMFHDLTPLSSRRQFGRLGTDDFCRRSAPTSASKGKEYIIPIKVEASSSRPDRDSSLWSSSKVGDEAHSRLHDHNGFTESTTQSSSSRLSGGGSSARGRVIHIPILRETTSHTSTREKSRSPPDFTPIIPTTDEHRSTQRKSDSSRRDDDVICLDSDAFFTQSRSTPRRYQRRYDDPDVEIVEVEAKEEETSKSLPRKPLRHDVANLSSSHNFSSGDETISTSQRLSRSSEYDVSKNDVGRREDGEANEAGQSKQSCAHSGVTNVTSPPTYPIYDHLRPRLASIGRQVDYIRGDGNCFFRALSKEMYGSEDYHAEWRQAVCDLIAAHPHVFQQYIDDSDVQAHVRQMRELGTWATTCEIYATASLLQRQIYVLAPKPSGGANSTEYNWLLFSPRRLTGSSAGTSSSKLLVQGGEGAGSHAEEVHPCYLTLCHTNGNHYDRIVPVFARCNCEMAPPSLNGVSLLLDLTASDEEELMQQ